MLKYLMAQDNSGSSSPLSWVGGGSGQCLVFLCVSMDELVETIFSPPKIDMTCIRFCNILSLTLCSHSKKIQNSPPNYVKVQTIWSMKAWVWGATSEIFKIKSEILDLRLKWIWIRKQSSTDNCNCNQACQPFTFRNWTFGLLEEHQQAKCFTVVAFFSKIERNTTRRDVEYR